RRESPDGSRGQFQRGQGLGVSCDHLLRRARVAVELAEESIAVLLGPVGQLLDEVLNLFAGGLSESLCAAEVDGIGPYQFGFELVLADDLAETVPNLRASAIPVSIRFLGTKLLGRIRTCSDLLGRADADAVGLAQRSIDCPSLGYPHFGSADQRRDIGRIGVTVTDKARGALGGKDRCLEDEAICPRITERIDGFNMNAAASLATRQAY